MKNSAIERELRRLEKAFGVTESKRSNLDVRRRFNRLLESELEKAQVVLVTKGVLEQLQSILEKISRIHANDVIPLLDEIQAQYGKEAAVSFREVVVQALDNASSAVMESREAIRNEVLKLEHELEGTSESSDMANDMDFGGGFDADSEDQNDSESDLGRDTDDEFNLADDIMSGDKGSVGRKRKEETKESFSRRKGPTLLERRRLNRKFK